MFSKLQGKKVRKKKKQKKEPRIQKVRNWRRKKKKKKNPKEEKKIKSCEVKSKDLVFQDRTFREFFFSHFYRNFRLKSESWGEKSEFSSYSLQYVAKVFFVFLFLNPNISEPICVLQKNKHFIYILSIAIKQPISFNLCLEKHVSSQNSGQVRTVSPQCGRAAYNLGCKCPSILILFTYALSHTKKDIYILLTHKQFKGLKFETCRFFVFFLNPTLLELFYKSNISRASSIFFYF